MYTIHKKGHKAEEIALQFLTQKGLTLIERNFSYPQYGEIDLIMKDHEMIVFVEVRMRGKQAVSSSLETVTPQKQRKIINTAHFYLQKNHLLYKINARFDVIGLDRYDHDSIISQKPDTNVVLDGEKIGVHWIKNAFNAE